MSDLLIASRADSPEEIIRPEFLELLASAKRRGCKVVILSNELDLFYGRAFRAKLNFLPKIDLIHDATYPKILKPEQVAYLNLVSELGTKPDECIVADDQERNILAIRSIGMKTVHFDVMNPQCSFAYAIHLLG